MSNDSQLYETAVPADEYEEGDEAASDFEPLEFDEELSAEVPWNKDDDPVVWLFKKEACLRFTAYALHEIRHGDPIYLNKSELTDEIGLSRQSAHRYIDDMVQIGVYEARRSGSVDRYRPNKNSRVLAAYATLADEIAQHFSTTEH